MTKQPIASTWPVLIALGLVGVLIVGMVGLDVILGKRVSDRTDVIIENTQLSIIALDKLRADAQNLSEPAVTERDARLLLADIATTSRAYDPLATFEGERAAWIDLQGLLQQLGATSTDDHDARTRLADAIDHAVDRLVDINAQEARENAAVIHAAHGESIVGDLIGGAVSFALMAVISVVLIRVLARQRTLVAEHIASLEDKNRDLEAFAGRAAHDLRSPMNPIRGYADLLLEAPDSPADVTMMAKRIRTAVDRMARVVDDMLALSTAGRPVPGVAATTEVITAILDELAPELHEATVKTELAAGRAACGEATLNQLLRNLIGNAIKYRSRARALEIGVATRDVEGMVEVTVADNGIGMDPEAAAHAFEPLYRGRADREVPGHGLGLAIVERTTRALGGTCALVSTADHGTRITVRIPAADQGT